MLKIKDGTGNYVTVNTATETIPWEAKGNGKCGGGAPAAASSATHNRGANGEKGGVCALCKKYPTTT